ncbi:thermonuclease family protein [Magnetospira sp. QH-2]|uniref:thermonuclease family protein n=1 Tax=Magnetospira sp. (strain QH-2) TaxID=1288970 RepID=UPI0003E814DF|nr:hypothetical protein [Magnetospira sp. QH-2]CCQ75411.1 putative Staphylococcal nuclease-like protein [Magnetospira sp. QH-2]
MVITFLCAYSAQAAPDIPGPAQVHAQVIRVIDGDTFEAMAYLGMDVYRQITIRVAGINTPELRSRCEDNDARARERALARQARDLSQEMLQDRVVTLIRPRTGTWRGRMVAEVVLEDGRYLAEVLTAADLSRGEGRLVWCAP